MKKDSQIPVLLGFLGVLLAVLVYFTVYRPYNEKTVALEAENATLIASLSRYEEIADNEAFYREAIDTYVDETRAIISEYAYGLIREDQIMYIANLENRFIRDIQVNYFNMGSDMEVPYGTAVDSSQAVTTGADTSTATSSFQEPVPVDNGIRMYENTIESGYEVSYEGIKDILEYISGVGTKKNITTVSLTFDSTSGMLTGSMNMSQYYLTGTDGTYSPTMIPLVKTGVENIFGTIDVDVENDSDIEE